MFIDERLLTVQSGAGGNGASAFHREKFVPMGGPSGGDGGRGGDVVLVADPQLTTFGDMEADRTFRAVNGKSGTGDKCAGSHGADRLVSVPPGTTVRDAETLELLVDLASPGDRWLAAKGGKGGLGNARFATATDQAPTRSTEGEGSIRRKLKLELRLLADAGLVGLPNAGKSTLLSRISRATPRIADYPFTTLEPHLGLVRVGEERSFVMADLPGLIEGAHEGKGLGLEFLRHVWRTRVLLILIDSLAEEPAKDMETLRVYIELEALRLDNKFSYHISIAPEIMSGDYKVPPLVIQPFVENAIHHGLLNKIDADRKLTIHVWASGNYIHYSVADNGVGRAKASAYKELNKVEHASMGMQISIDRINLFNLHHNGAVVITDLFDAGGAPAGTKVEVTLINQ